MAESDDFVNCFLSLKEKDVDEATRTTLCFDKAMMDYKNSLGQPAQLDPIR